MCNMQALYLNDNTIGNAGLSALAEAVGKGALAPGASVFLSGNNATETGKQAMRDCDAAKARGLIVYLL